MNNIFDTQPKTSHSKRKSSDGEPNVATKLALDYMDSISLIKSLQDLGNFGYLTVAGLKDRPSWLKQGLSKSAWKDICASIKYQLSGDTLESQLRSLDLTESQVRKLWALVNSTTTIQFPEVPQQLICDVVLSNILRGTYDGNPNASSIPETLNGQSYASKSRVLTYMQYQLHFDYDMILKSINYVGHVIGDYVMFRKYYQAELKLKELLTSIEAKGPIKLIAPDILPLSDDQLNIFNSTGRVLTISGEPGTGKTTVTESVLMSIKSFLGGKMDCMLMAFTHAAKNRMGKNQTLNDLANCDKGTIKGVQTIHSTYYKIIGRGEKYNPKKCVIVFDEISMIGMNMYPLINRIIDESDPEMVIFVGDRQQLAPVRTVGSLPSTLDHITSNNYKLTTCHRSIKDIYNTFHHILDRGNINCADPHCIEIPVDELINRDKGESNYSPNSLYRHKLIDLFFDDDDENNFDTIVIQFRNVDRYINNWIILSELIKRGAIDPKSNPLYHTKLDVLRETCTRCFKSGTWDKTMFWVGMQVIGVSNDSTLKNGIRGIINSITVDKYERYMCDITDVYGNSHTITSAEIDPFYASTCHKMQGEEAKHIIYQWSDIDTVQLAYTATSRAKARLSILVPTLDAPHKGFYPLKHDVVIKSALELQNN